MTFSKITYANVDGLWARKGNRAVEVVRESPDEWMTFATIDDAVCRGGPSRVSKAEAMAWARRFLEGKETPEVWPGAMADIPGKTRTQWPKTQLGRL